MRGYLAGAGCSGRPEAAVQGWVHAEINSMAYQVLARKYRPRQFDEVIAQRHVTQTLQNALKSGRTSSGYLFTGPRGTGKTTTARLLAKALNCIEGPTPTPCDNCPACREIAAGSSLDVLEIDAASNTGVDDIRALRENVRYLPTSGKKRIYIIDEVHRLSGSAFDALLKTLEEPPEHVVFMLATTEPHKVPETIRSRTQRYDFRRVSASDLSDHLRKISDAENIVIDDDAIYILARKADGSVRDAMSLLDQLSAFAGEKITTAHVIEALGLIDRQFFLDYTRAVASRDSAAGLDMIKKLIDSGVEINDFCHGLVEHFRNLLVLLNASDPEKLLVLSETELAALVEQKDFFVSGDLLRLIKIITDLSLDLRSGLDPRLLLETATLKLTNLDATVTFEEILAHLAKKGPPSAPVAPEPAADLFGHESPPPAPVSPVAISPAKNIAAEPTETVPGKINLPVIQTGWPRFLEQLKTKNQMLAAHLSMVEIREVKDNTITAVFYNNGGTSKQVVEKTDYLNVVMSVLRDCFKANLRIRFEIDHTHKPAATARPSAAPPKIDSAKILAENDKLKSLVERFDGEIIGMKEIDE